jgi:hypothetical protein
MKKQYFLLCTIVLACILVHAQELKTKKKWDQFSTEIFQIDKKSKLKQGTYLKIKTTDQDTLMYGQYLNDSITGVWTYFDMNNQPRIKYDYSKNNCLWTSELINKPDTFPVRNGSSFNFAQLDRPPIYLGFIKEVELILSQIKLPVSLMEKGESLFCTADFVVTKDGKIAEVQTKDIDNYEIRSKVNEAFKEIKGHWLPGILSGSPVDTKLYVVFDIGPAGIVKKLPKKPYVLNISINYLGVKTDRVTSTQVVGIKNGNIGPSNAHR